MKTNARLFWILAAFFALADVAYIVWTYIDEYEAGIEWVGSVALGLTAVLAAFIAFYLGRVFKTQGGILPEDRHDANIDDGDPELGFFSPWSWWPIVLAAGAATVFLGIAVGFWLAYLGVLVAVIALVGWTYEYYRGYFAR